MTSRRAQRSLLVAEKPSGTKESPPSQSPNSRPKYRESSTNCELEHMALRPSLHIPATASGFHQRYCVFGMLAHMTNMPTCRPVCRLANRLFGGWSTCRLSLDLARKQNHVRCARTSILRWAEIAARLHRVADLLYSQHRPLKSIDEHNMNRNHDRQGPSQCDVHRKHHSQSCL